MKVYKLRYTTAFGLQFNQVFDSEEDRNNAFKLIGSTERIYAGGTLVRVTENVVCVEVVDADVENTVEDFRESDG